MRQPANNAYEKNDTKYKITYRQNAFTSYAWPSHCYEEIYYSESDEITHSVTPYFEYLKNLTFGIVKGRSF